MSAAVPLSSLALPRRTSVLVGVVAAHAALLWLAQRASMHHPVENIVPVQLLQAELTPPRVQQPAAPVTPPHIEPQRRSEPPPKVEPQRRREPLPRPPVPAVPRAVAPAPVPAITAPPAPPAPYALAVPASPPAAAAPAAVPAPAPAAKLELPISDADYLQNPQPAWPRQSQRLGEKGLVVLRVLIGTDGRARKAEIAQSSGYPRLDNASLAAVLDWRYVPGKRGGVPEEMWVRVPIRWGD